MWDEDPRWHQANFRLLIWAAGIGSVGGFVLALCSGDWKPYQLFLEILSGFLAVLCTYAVLIWIIGHSSIKLWGFLKKWIHKQD